MGWNQLQFRNSSPLFNGLESGVYCYFVHSYYVVPKDRAVIAAETDYGGPFCSVIRRDNLFATQFHPEKSQRDGLKMLANFAQL
jgi:glutamine amidotransferase